MTTSSDEPKVPGALAALTELGRDRVKRPTPMELDHGLNLLFARVAAGRSRRRGLVRWSLVGAMAVLSTLVILRVKSVAIKASSVSVPALAYHIDGGTVLDGGYLRESGHAGMNLRFSEGTAFEFMPGTRGRLRAVSPDGARVAIDNGRVSFSVTPSSERHWFVEAGPFVVTVKGTVFLVSWDPSSERFELSLRQGSVVVSGPVAGGGQSLLAGQRLVVNLSRGETLITEDGLEQAVVEPVSTPAASNLTPAAPQPSMAQATPARLPPSTAHAPSAAGATEGGERRWVQALASGHWDRILEEVERTGVDGVLNGASSEELFALADAARYRRRVDLARAALLAERRRFPNSPRAVDAIFLLGRVEESRDGGAVRAVALFDEYLARAPAGGYAAEALGRKMILTKQSGGVAEARSIAEEYLKRFPKGSYVGSARALLRVP